MPRLKNALHKNLLEAGCDEAGRGCLAGPVVAAAVILPKGFRCKDLNDSKKLSAKKRNELREIIEAKAIAYSVNFVDHKIIDEINILNASFLAMTNSVKTLRVQPEHLLIDGNRFKTDLEIPYSCIIQGDGKFKSIAAASILAKTYRDEYMEEMNLKYPLYQWSKNKAYPTKEHRKAIKENGVSPIHRLTFKLLPDES